MIVKRTAKIPKEIAQDHIAYKLNSNRARIAVIEKGTMPNKLNVNIQPAIWASIIRPMLMANTIPVIMVAEAIKTYSSINKENHTSRNYVEIHRNY